MLPRAHTHFKFVVDGNWVVNDTIRKEHCGHGIVNNVILPEDFLGEQPEARLVNRRLDRILARIHDDSVREACELHEISDLWLPMSRQTVQKLIPSKVGREAFLAAQNDLLDIRVAVWEGNTVANAQDLGHSAIDDDEELIIEHRVLGEGAFGTVEEISIVSGAPETRCVRKRVARPKQLKAQKSVMAAFAREISVMRQVVHQHCVQFVGSYTDTHHVNILSNPIADMDLATLLDSSISLEERIIIFRGIGCLCNAINYLHQNKIRHEDLKPQNILIHGNNILLTDFGFSLDFSEDSVSTTTGRPSAWTVRYSAPEVLDSEPRNRATDIYSLGCVLVEMISAYYGFSLSEVKAYWRQTGNGQSSFARNTDATTTWLHGPKLSSRMQASRESKLDLIYIYLPSMLDADRNHRPAAQQVTDRLSDINALLLNTSLRNFVGCQGPYPCIGLSSSESPIEKFPALAGCQLPRYLAGYLIPWMNTSNWDYSLWNMDMEVSSIDGLHHGVLNAVIENIDAIRLIGKNLRERACKTGATKHFWEAYKRRFSQSPNAQFEYERRVSTGLLSLKHSVFTRMTLYSDTADSSAKSNVQITLLPICLPRSENYGLFYWLVSYPLRGSAVEEHYDAEKSFVDLTAGPASNHS